MTLMRSSLDEITSYGFFEVVARFSDLVFFLGFQAVSRVVCLSFPGRDISKRAATHSHMLLREVVKNCFFFRFGL